MKEPAKLALAYPLVVGGRLIGLGKTRSFELSASGELRTFLNGRLRCVSHQALLDYIAAREAASNREHGNECKEQSHSTESVFEKRQR